MLQMCGRNTYIYDKNMEVMEKKLYDACLDGDIDALNTLMKEDKLILARLSLSSCFNQTPLHFACMFGHFEFAKSLLSYKPDFASRLDSQARSPLHLASANGYADIVQMLLAHHDKNMCQVRDEDGRTPLHLAVMNGQHDSVCEFFKVDSEYVQAAEMPELLHLCVMYNRLNILVLILDQSHGKNISNIKIDDNGNTILHSATTLRRLQIIKYLVRRRRSEVDLSVVNKDGLTALDIAEKMPKDAKTMETKELLAAAAATDERAEEISPSGEVADGTTEIQAAAGGAGANANFSNRKPPVTKKWRKMKRDESLLVAATVIAAMAYQASLNPPGGVAQQDPIESTLAAASPAYNLGPGESIIAYFYSNLSDVFWISNTISFFASLCVILVFVSGATLKQRYFTWIIRAAMWITLSSMTVTYVFAVIVITPLSRLKGNYYTLIGSISAWIVLLFISTLVVVYRILPYMFRNILRNFKSCMVVVYRSLRHIVRMIMPKRATNQFAAISSNPTNV